VDSLWSKTSPEPDFGEQFEPGLHCDLAVVGGGYTGLSTALHAAEKGVSVVVIEAHDVGFGGSGRNVGLVNAGVWLSPTQVVETMGPRFGQRFLQCFSDAPEQVFGLIDRFQINCEATRTGTIHAAHSSPGVRDLQERFQAWQQLEQPVDFLERDEVVRMTGTRRFHAGLLDRRAGMINPMGYCRGLARAAAGKGGKIFTGVQAKRLSRARPIWRIDTNLGSISAEAVVLATNAYTERVWPGLDKTFTIIHFFQIATVPLGGRAAHVLPGRQGLWDTGKVMFACRRDANDRLIVGSMGKVIGNARSGLTRRWAQKRIKHTFPDLGHVEFEYAWHGKIAMTPDHLPRICRLSDGLWTAIGYNGRGITTGTVFGKLLAGLACGASPDSLPSH